MRISSLPRGLRGFHSVWTSIVGAVFALMLTQSAEAATVSLSAQANCSNVALCDQPLLIIPANRAFTITNASCSIVHGSTAVEILDAQLHITNAAGTVLVRDAVVPTLNGTGPVTRHFAFNEQTTLVLSPAQRLRIHVSTDAISFVIISCKLAGDWRVV
jgi:hypothetical protein